MMEMAMETGRGLEHRFQTFYISKRCYGLS